MSARTLTDADVLAVARAVAKALREVPDEPAILAAKPRLSLRASAKLLGIQPRTFTARYVAQGFIAPGADKRFARAAVMRLRERGQ